MIELEHISKRYGDKLAVDDVSFVVRPGVVTGIRSALERERVPTAS